MGKLAIFGGSAVNPNGHVRWPIVTQADKEAVMEVLDSKVLWGSTAPKQIALEQEWARYTGSKYVLACNSGTAALHMAVAAAGIGPGDEIITPSLTFVATQMCAIHHNAVPVFVDVDPVTFNMDVSKIEEKITPRTKAIIPVDLHGQPADYDEINAIAKKHNLVVIADCAQSHGAYYKGIKTGTLADISIFSLNGLKNLQCGDGGLLNTDSEAYLQKADQCRVFGEIVEAGKPRNYNSVGVGWLYRLTEMPAALTLSRLKLLDEENAVRVQNAELLTAGLKNIPGVTPPYIKPDRTSVYHHYRIMLDPTALGLDIEPNLFRAKVQKALNAEGIEAKRWQTRPVQCQGLFQERIGYGKGCPWRCEYRENRYIDYGAADYRVTQRILENSIVFADVIYPPNGVELMGRVLDGFYKLWENLDEVLRIEVAPSEHYLAY